MEDGESRLSPSKLYVHFFAFIVASYVGGPVPGGPAVTRHPYGDGAGWYVASRLDPEATDALVDLLIEESGVTPVAATRPGVEVTRRHQADGADSWVFVVNHTDEPATLDLTGHDLVTDQPVMGRLSVPAGGVAVVREVH